MEIATKIVIAIWIVVGLLILLLGYLIREKIK